MADGATEMSLCDEALVKTVMKQMVNDRLMPFHSLHVDWDTVEAECGFPASECKTKWEALISQVRQYRTFHEIASDIMMVAGLCTNTYAEEKTILGKPPYKCQKCNFISKKKYNFDRHRRFHDTGLKFQCADCDRSFSDKYRLQMHVDIKHYGKFLVCSVCTHLFKSETTLYRHERKIHNIGYTCENCGKRFISQSNFAVHVKGRCI